MSFRKTCLMFSMMAVATLMVGCGNSTALQGKGATFPETIYQQWFKDFSTKNAEYQVTYTGTGSGDGVQSMIDGIGEFGASDVAMKPEEVEKVKRGVVMLPLTAGGIVLAFNVNDKEGNTIEALKLPREAYAGIFLGKVQKWNDPLIQDANPDVQLPEETIKVIVRADKSGTSAVFTQHLSAISEEFNTSIGESKEPAWPVQQDSLVKGKGNAGVTTWIDKTPNSIGYIEFGYAIKKELKMAQLENKSGNYITASTESTQATLAAVELPENLVAFMPDPEGDESYPIVSFSWLLLYKQYDNPKVVEGLKKLVNYCVDEGQKQSVELGYIPIPESVGARVKTALEQVGTK